MSDFTRDWLRLRESADLAARDPALARQFALLLAASPGRPLRIIDLGAGSGANARALLPRLPGDQHWLLVERDRALLAAQAEEFTLWARRQGYPIRAGGGRMVIEAPPACWEIETMPLDLARDPASLDALAVDGMTAAAFFDLVSPDWLERFVAIIARQRVPLLAALTVDGRRDWQPPIAEDAAVAAAFARHQRRDKGFGPALGPAAAQALEAALAAAGFSLRRAASDWRLGRGGAALLDALIAGEAAAAREAAPETAATIAVWERERRMHRVTGRLGLTLGHCDLLAWPA